MKEWNSEPHKFLIGKRVKNILNGKSFRINGVDFNKNIFTEFPDKIFKNYQEFYQEIYGIKDLNQDQFLVFSENEKTLIKNYYPP